MFMGLFVIYGFDTASTLAEETNDPRQVAPRAVLGSIASAFVIGFVFLWAMLMAIPGYARRRSSRRGGISPPEIIEANLSKALATGYLLVVSFAIFVCCLAIQASTIRLAYGDGARPPAARLRSRSARSTRRTGTPVGACIAVALMAAIFLLKYAGVAYIAIAASGMIYLSYILANLAILERAAARLLRAAARCRSQLGRWGMLVNILALVWGGAMMINFALAPGGDEPEAERDRGVLDFNSGFLNNIPILWSVLGAVLILGAIYYGARELARSRRRCAPRRRPSQPYDRRAAPPARPGARSGAAAPRRGTDAHVSTSAEAPAGDVLPVGLEEQLGAARVGARAARRRHHEPQPPRCAAAGATTSCGCAGKDTGAARHRPRGRARRDRGGRRRRRRRPRCSPTSTTPPALVTAFIPRPRR